MIRRSDLANTPKPTLGWYTGADVECNKPDKLGLKQPVAPEPEKAEEPKKKAAPKKAADK